MTARLRPTVARIDLDAIRHNVRALGGPLGRDVQRLAVVKANAYGHGDVEVARAALDAGATWLGVALVEEGLRLREAGIDAPILLLVEPTPEAAKDVVAAGLTASVSTLPVAEALAHAATLAGSNVRVHACIDTGMHREGAPIADARTFVTDLARLAGIEVEGLWSHLAIAEEPDHPATRTQISRFAAVCDEIAKAGVDVPIKHLSSSAAIALYPEAHFDLVRMGIMLYGLHPGRDLVDRVDLRAAMHLTSAVGLVRRVPAGEGVSYGHTFVPGEDTTIATVPIGYGDGYPRLLSNRADVLIGGRRTRVAGRVTMDTIMADCGNADVSAGDEVVLIGRQGDEEVTATELADIVGTINYEIVCGIGPRVPRTYVG